MSQCKNSTPPTLLRAIALAALLCTATANAQRATEVFIPIGQSPGVSGKYTTIGTVDSLNMKGGTLTVSDSGRTYVIRFTKKTRVYIDRSSYGKPNSRGTMGHCKTGMIVEVKYVENKADANAEWIKLKEE